MIWCIAKIMPVEAAALAELVAHIGDIADAEALTAECLRHLDAEQTLCLDGLKGLGGEASGAVDCDSVSRRDSGDGFWRGW